jgi:predicted dehydrogenase
LGLRVMDAGKDYFTDKAPFTTLEQLASARKKVAETGRKYAVYYAERIHTECGVRAGQLIAEGAIGRVVQVLGMGPHRSNPKTRPDWFWDPARNGGLLCDIGSHQFEQFLTFSGATDATVVRSAGAWGAALFALCLFAWLVLIRYRAGLPAAILVLRSEVCGVSQKARGK